MLGRLMLGWQKHNFFILFVAYFSKNSEQGKPSIIFGETRKDLWSQMEHDRSFQLLSRYLATLLLHLVLNIII